MGTTIPSRYFREVITPVREFGRRDIVGYQRQRQPLLGYYYGEPVYELTEEMLSSPSLNTSAWISALDMPSDSCEYCGNDFSSKESIKYLTKHGECSTCGSKR